VFLHFRFTEYTLDDLTGRLERLALSDTALEDTPHRKVTHLKLLRKVRDSDWAPNLGE